MKIITVINEPRHPGFNMLRLSCAVNQLDLVVLMPEDRRFETNRVKDQLLLSYLHRSVADDEIVFFTDGNDALMMCDEEEILRKFHETGKELVFSAESGCWPDESLAEKYPRTATRYRYLNSGGFIGKAGTIKKFLSDNEHQDSLFPNSNQYLWIKRFFKYPEKIGLDTPCTLFHTFSPEVSEHYAMAQRGLNVVPYYLSMKKWFNANFVIGKGRIYSKITGTWPCQVHFNGPSKWLIDSDIIDLLFGKVSGAKPARFISVPTD